jgi:O-antigen/teichoic acid export membrane protein
MGIYALASTLTAVLSPLAAMGLATGVLVQGARPDGESRLARGYRAVVRFTVAATAVAGLLVWGLLHLRVGQHLFPGLQRYAAALALLVAATALRELASALPQFRGEVGFLSTLNLAIDYGGVLLSIVLLFAGWGPGGLLWGYALPIGAGAAFSLIRSLRMLPGRSGSGGGLLAAALGVGWTTLPMSISQSMLQTVDRVVLGRSQGVAEVGVYSLACTISTAVLVVAGTLNLFFFAWAAAAWRAGIDAFRVFLERSLRVVALVVGLFVAGAATLGKIGIVVVAGDQWLAAGSLLPWLTLAYGIGTLTQVLHVVPLLMEGRAARLSACYVAMALLNIAANLILVPRWGAAGAAASAVLTHSAGLALVRRAARRSLPMLRLWTPLAGPALLTAAAAAAGAALAPPARGGPLALAGAALVLTAAYGAVARSRLWLLDGANPPSAM